MPTMRNHPYIEVGKLYRIDRDDIHAFAESPDEGMFVLLAGSTVTKPLSMPYAMPLYNRKEDMDDCGTHYSLRKDVAYSDPTLCACAVLGGRVSGRVAWSLDPVHQFPG